MTMYDTHSTDMILCPHCDTCHSREWEDMPTSDGDQITITCKNCDTPFVVRAWETINWTTMSVEDAE